METPTIESFNIWGDAGEIPGKKSNRDIVNQARWAEKFYTQHFFLRKKQNFWVVAILVRAALT